MGGGNGSGQEGAEKERGRPAGARRFVLCGDKGGIDSGWDTTRLWRAGDQEGRI